MTSTRPQEKKIKNSSVSGNEPMTKGPNKGPKKLPKVKKETITRLLSYLKGYKVQFIFVLVCITISAIVGVAGSMFLQTLIDDYITPLLLEANPVFTQLLRAVITMAGIYLIGVISTLIYNRLMVTISQGILKKVRDDMFAHMQKLPIKYFDTHNHGDIMSHYTNDTDTLRQMLSQSIPQVFSSIITIVSVFCAMLYTSIYLTIFIVIFIFFMMMVVKKIGGNSAKYFIKQQQSIGALNGYIEELINGQKVVKVFCHEEKSKQGFNKLNEALCQNATEANKFANILMPIMQNLGNLQYVLIAIVIISYLLLFSS